MFFNFQDAEQSSKHCYAHSPMVVSIDLGIIIICLLCCHSSFVFCNMLFAELYICIKIVSSRLTL